MDREARVRPGEQALLERLRLPPGLHQSAEDQATEVLLDSLGRPGPHRTQACVLPPRDVSVLCVQ